MKKKAQRTAFQPLSVAFKLVQIRRVFAISGGFQTNVEITEQIWRNLLTDETMTFRGPTDRKLGTIIILVEKPS